MEFAAQPAFPSAYMQQAEHGAQLWHSAAQPHHEVATSHYGYTHNTEAAPASYLAPEPTVTPTPAPAPAPLLTVTDEDLAFDLDYANLFEESTPSYVAPRSTKEESLPSYVAAPRPIKEEQLGVENNLDALYNAAETDKPQQQHQQQQDSYAVPHSPREVCAQPASLHMSPEACTRPTATPSQVKPSVRKDCIRPRAKRPRATSSKIVVIGPNGCELSTRNQKLTSPFKGVCWYKRTKKWVVQVKIRGYRQHVGYFEDEELAAKAYKEALEKITSQHLV